MRLPRQAWLDALGSDDVALLRRRMEWDGIKYDAGDLAPAIALDLPDAEGFSQLRQWLIDAPSITVEPSPAQPPTVAFEELWQRVADAAIDRLSDALPEPLLGQPLRRNLRDSLVRDLAGIGEALLWQEFNSRRTTEQIVAVHLESAASGQPIPRTIYATFLEELRGTGLDCLVSDFPVLKRHLATALRQWFTCSHELLTRIADDRELLTEVFGLPGDAVLDAVTTRLSDPHRGGKTVCLLEFRNPAGSPYRLMYKPKDMRIDAEFHRLIAAVPSPLASDSPLRHCAIAELGDYGYMEWVPHTLCTSDAELARFYRNAGRLTAILHVLGCSDCHHENLIAASDQLVLIDAETLFEGVQVDGRDDTRPTLGRTRLYDQVNRSVARLGLLPEWRFVGAQRDTTDGSALGIAPPRQHDRDFEGWQELNSDGMIRGEVRLPTYLATSSPVGPGSQNRLGEFVDDFCSGFTDQLHGIARSTALWLSDGGLLPRFRGLRRRYVPRATWLYVWIHHQLTEPAALTSESAQRLVLENLARTQLKSAVRPATWPLLALEIEQAGCLDVPFLSQQVDSVDLVCSGTTIRGFMRRSGYDEAHDKITGLDRSAIELQEQVIRGMVFAKARIGDAHVETVRAATALDRFAGNARSEAIAFADHLVGSAIHQGGAVEWLGIDVGEDIERSRYGPLGLSLYSGRAGLALFLASMAARRQGPSDCRRIALGACADLLAAADTDGSDEIGSWCRSQPLGLAGVGGVLLVLHQLADLIPEMAPSATRALNRIVEGLSPDLLRADVALDIINGVAGLIGPLLLIGSPAAVSLAAEAADVLIAQQDPCGGWRIDAAGSRVLTGFSHGAAGIAAALARLDAMRSDPDLRTAVRRALDYERTTYDAAQRNWPDYRDPEIEFAVSWCHGAPGIALSRLCLSGTALWDADAGQELDHALATTAVGGSPGDSLCCGNFGRAVILRLAAHRLSEPAWRDAAIRLEDASWERRAQCGRYSFLDIPGLFTGAAGVGLACLESLGSPEIGVLAAVLSAGLYRSGGP